MHDFARKMIYKWWVFHIYVSLQEGKLLWKAMQLRTPSPSKALPTAHLGVKGLLETAAAANQLGSRDISVVEHLPLQGRWGDWPRGIFVEILNLDVPQVCWGTDSMISNHFLGSVVPLCPGCSQKSLTAALAEDVICLPDLVAKPFPVFKAAQKR